MHPPKPSNKKEIYEKLSLIWQIIGIPGALSIQVSNSYSKHVLDMMGLFGFWASISVRDTSDWQVPLRCYPVFSLELNSLLVNSACLKGKSSLYLQ